MKRVLVITYYWPPSGGPGVQRILKFCKYLPQFGWEPIVLTIRNGEYPSLDYSLLGEARQLEITTYKARAIEPFRLFKFLTGKKELPTYQLNKRPEGSFGRVSQWLRLNLFIPDARVSWVPFARKAANKILTERKINLLFTSGPPHSVHLIARAIRKKSKLPWVVDFRDPWTDLFYYEGHRRTSKAKSKDLFLQRLVMEDADRVITVSSGFKELLSTDIGAAKLSVIHNGYDEDDFSQLSIRRNEGSVRICHLGTLSQFQNPIVLFQALDNLGNLRPDLQFRLDFVGDTHPEVMHDLEAQNLSRITRHHGYLPHGDALKILLKSDFLLLVVPRTGKNSGIIPGKIFEYIRSGVTIILISPLDCDAARIVRETHSGFVFDYDDLDGLSKILSSRPRIQPTNYEKYSRRNLTSQLAELFDQLV